MKSRLRFGPRRFAVSCLAVGLVTGIIFGSRPTEAQFTGSYQTNIISGVTNNPDGYCVGCNYFYDALLIQSNGVLSVPADSGITVAGYIGTNNSVLITGPGSAILNNGGFDFGGVCCAQSTNGGNSLVISNGAKMFTSNLSMIFGANATTPNTVLVTDPGSVWSNSMGLYVGSWGAGSSLVIRNGGVVVSMGNFVYVGYDSSSSYANVLVTDPGSVWTNTFPLVVGNKAANDSLVISNGGKVFSGSGSVGGAATANGNSVQVVGSGSVWVVNQFPAHGLGPLHIGGSGSGNSLVISNGGQVFDGSAVVGSQLGSSSNTVVVTGGGVWQAAGLTVGGQGSSNRLLVDGGSVFAQNLVVGAASPTCDNTVELDSGDLMVTNNGAGVLEVRNGQLILNGGTLWVDTLLITSSCASFVHTGGTLIVGNVVLDPNTFRITSITPQGNDMLITWMMGPGATNALQVTSGGVGGSYNTNGFSDIFIVTNNTTVGTVTNYLDVGAATNMPARYYRARLVP